MERILSAFALSFSIACGVANAQVADSTDVNSSKVDSLTQVVESLSSQISDAENEDLQKAIWKDRAKYMNVGFVKQTLTSKDNDVKYKSSAGMNLTWGKTYYLHKKPILNMIKIGLDWSWMDFTYVKYSEVEETYEGEYANPDDYWDVDFSGEEELDLGCHQLEYGMQLGPSITVNPIHHLKVSTYFHFQPSGSVILLDDEVYYGFVPFFNFGAAVAWKAISIGVEGRWGATKYSGASVDDEEDSSYWEEGDADFSDLVDTFSQRMCTKSFRAYISLRF